MATKTDWENGDVLEASDVSTYLANSGLDFVTQVSVGTSSVSSVTVTNAFSATWTNYKIVYQGIDTSSMAAIKFQFVDSSSNPVTTDYESSAFKMTLGTTTTAGEGYDYWYIGEADGYLRYGSFDVYCPYEANYKFMCGDQITRFYYRRFGGYYSIVDYAYPSFRFIGDAGTFQNGSITVYGYRIA